MHCQGLFMPSPEVIDFPALLSAIPGEQPAGRDLRVDASPNSAYYTIKDARSSARAAERQMLLDGATTSSADWRPVVQNGMRALAEDAKDLEVIAYLIEALVREYGFAGLRDGFRLARETVEQYWDGLYPLPDEEGVDTRVAPLTGLNGEDSEGTLINPIQKVPLTQGESVGPFAFYHYQQALALEQLVDPEAREARIAQGAVTMQMLRQAVAETPAAFFAGLVEDMAACQDEFAKLNVALDERCGSRAPPSSNIRSALTACLDAVNDLARDKLAVAQASDDATQADGSAARADGAQAAAAGEIRTRDDAFRALLKIADFFRRTEPQALITYSLEQAVRWGRMPLPDLLTELIPDEGARLQLFKQVGIRPPEPPSS
jgi:type VI secretion system protein ImpA